ncbi:hypothetical protein [Companilactobacillus halodurans]|uniref:Uncharacterized protein n=1 Tax=Companilactobacillus halodurans TaxID=2584183 RepID=A0A5P0ZQY7_9LACO|nr:hypothetical protein [Companilactobacillus halodurans]MQS76485.1 hypothetical protein [Companilactobacillus halodurans]MQS97066.1 hypothetical protein [Companilactobacillus halodurans]
MSKVNNFIELVEAISTNEPKIEIKRNITVNYPLIISPNTKLVGIPQENKSLPALIFQDSDGIGVTQDNQISDLSILAPSEKRAIFSASFSEDLGHFEFKNLTLSGQFSFIAKSPTKTADLILNKINILQADARHYLEQPQKYGVNVLQGALTIYNFNSDSSSLLTIEATDISIGQENNPVFGSGVFIAGFGDNGGKVKVKELQTNEVHSTGKIPFGVADLITGAIFIVNGAYASSVIQSGKTTTYGVNDMVLDAWGEVDNWVVNDTVTSYGPSGIGFVNFGTFKTFTAKAPIETYGLGARAYNQYDGTLEEGHFSSINTFGDGSIGIQISKKVGSIFIDGDIKTNGDTGNSLVKGINVKLPANALSIKNGGEVKKLNIHGNIETFGKQITSLVADSGAIVHNIKIDGQILAHGENSETTNISSESTFPYI